MAGYAGRSVIVHAYIGAVVWAGFSATCSRIFFFFSMHYLRS